MNNQSVIKIHPMDNVAIALVIFLKAFTSIGWKGNNVTATSTTWA